MARALDRSEAGIRNIRHRLKLIADTKDKLPKLLEEKDRLYGVLEELLRRQTVMSHQIREMEKMRDKISLLLARALVSVVGVGLLGVLGAPGLAQRLLMAVLFLWIEVMAIRLFQISGQSFVSPALPK